MHPQLASWMPGLHCDPFKKYPVIEKIYAGPHGSFVPKSLFEEESLNEYLNKNIDLKENDFISYDVIARADWINVYVPFVDEASMISDSTNQNLIFKNSSLLNDLVEYVFSGENCKLLFIGDSAQLPPVQSLVSPAMDKNGLESKFGYGVEISRLEEVVRQKLDSGILFNSPIQFIIVLDQHLENIINTNLCSLEYKIYIYILKIFIL